MKLFSTLFATALALSLGIVQAQAATSSALSFSSSQSGGYSPAASVRGWAFEAQENFDIVALGLIDITNGSIGIPGDGPGFATAHSVVLWDNAGTELGRVTIQPGTASAVGPGNLNGPNVIRYESLANPISVLTGNTYVVSAFFSQNSFDANAANGFRSTTIFDSRIQSRGLRFGGTASHLFPTASDPRFSFNATSFLIADAQQPPAVPLPASGILLVMGIGGIAALRRKRR
ncbi:VPLPA-CTERM sorting domain-containing protein [uncultured Tateyamaria sp.]|uniref:VPLPA-CTERM sorting domain-containing protein n=1 Tax=uncultured Tateyamaria sp. TaxID=455651 RepID=UPI00261B2C52|nr:VPLPA-CTERM sorting domain-containing protein [uncultured Tateyamaria sp.]